MNDMKTKYIISILFLLITVAALAQKKKPNIINYFASNNQIIGVPMVDLDNEFRFYPDLSFQEAITGIEVYYFVLNDVYKHHLSKREDGRYWSCTMRDFSLGEAIQRVEVIVDCNKKKADTLLQKMGISNLNKGDWYFNYLFLRRGDDKRLLQLKTFNELQKNAKSEFDTLKAKLKEINDEIASTNEFFSSLNENLNSATHLQSSFAKLNAKLVKVKTLTNKEKETVKIVTDTLNKYVEAMRDTITIKKDLEKFSRGSQKIDSIYSELQQTIQNQQDEINSRIVSYQTFQNKLEPLNLRLGEQTHYDREFDLIKEISSNPENRNYSAYVENRLASMLDMKDKNDSIVQFNYRNDKQSLQYLQADDPQEKLGIFRARLVPFPFYQLQQKDVNGNFTKETTDFQWQRGKVIYEIGINFGYTIVKGDHFMPKFFDMNRLGLGIGISSDTFSDKPTYLSVSLTYDMNTYTSLSFGANLIDKPGFYMGVGINARAFKDLVKNSGALFKGN